MDLTRKEFLKISAAATAGGLSGATALLTGCSNNDFKYDKVKTVICPMCAAGCGLKLLYKKDKVFTIRGDADNPLSEGFLCHRAISLIDLLNNKNSNKVKYRRPYSDKWEEITVQEACDIAADKIYKTRNITFKESEHNVKVNRTEGIASIVGNNLTNEELYSIRKFLISLGITDAGSEHFFTEQGKYRALKSCTGVAAETNPISDISNSDYIVVIGADPAGDSPIYNKYIEKARDNGAFIWNIDPMKTGTSSISDKYISINPSTDLVLINAVIYYILKNKLYDRNYLEKNTDAGNIVSSEFDYNSMMRVFSGYDHKSRSYNDKASWSYVYDKRGNPEFSHNFNVNNSVMKNMESVFSEYSPSMVKNICDIEINDFLSFAEKISSAAKENKKISFVTGRGLEGQCQSSKLYHSIIILLLLTGSFGKPGGGLYSISKFSNIQGLQDFFPSWNELPGNIPLPVCNQIRKDSSYSVYVRNNTPVSNDSKSYNYYKNYERLSSSQLRAFFGKQNLPEDVYRHLPKINNKISNGDFIDKLHNSKYKGVLLFNSDLLTLNYEKNKIVDGLKKMDWIIGTTVFDNYSMSLWKDSPKTNKTEVLLFPSSISIEKPGSITTISRNIYYSSESLLSTKENYRKVNIILGKILNSLRNKIDSSTLQKESIMKINLDNDSKNIFKEISGFSNKMEISSFEDLNINESVCGNHFYCGASNINQDKEVMKSELRILDESDNKFINKYYGFAWPSSTVFLYNLLFDDNEKILVSNDIASNKYDYISGGPSLKNKKPFYFLTNGKAKMHCEDSSIIPLPVYYSEFENGNSFLPDPCSDYLGKIKQIYIIKNSSDKDLINNTQYIEQVYGKNLLYYSRKIEIDDNVSSKFNLDYNPLIIKRDFQYLQNITNNYFFQNLITNRNSCNTKHLSIDTNKIKLIVE